MKERKGQCLLCPRDSCLSLEPRQQQHPGAAGTALGGTGASRVQVKHERSHHSNASTASLSPTPGASETPLALCLSSTSVATSMHSWPMRWQCPAGKRPGRLTGWQGRVWRSCAGRAQGAWDGRVALRWVPGCGFVIHAERLVLPLDLLGRLHRHQLIPSFPKPPRQQPALIQLLAAPALLQVLLQAHLGSPCAPSPKRNRRPPGREHRGGDPLRSPLPC